MAISSSAERLKYDCPYLTLISCSAMLSRPASFFRFVLLVDIVAVSKIMLKSAFYMTFYQNAELHNSSSFATSFGRNERN
jgi:hypothetical protein